MLSIMLGNMLIKNYLIFKIYSLTSSSLPFKWYVYLNNVNADRFSLSFDKNKQNRNLWTNSSVAKGMQCHAKGIQKSKKNNFWKVIKSYHLKSLTGWNDISKYTRVYKRCIISNIATVVLRKNISCDQNHWNLNAFLHRYRFLLFHNI